MKWALKAEMNNNDKAHRDQVVRLLMDNRSSLFAFIFAAVREFDAAEDILQEVAVAICENADGFEVGTNFRAWAREIARRRISAHWRSTKRNINSLSEDQLSGLADGFSQAEASVPEDDRVHAIRECLQKLKPFMQRIFQLRYSQQMDLAVIANEVGRQPDSVRKTLYRGRVSLRECVDRRLGRASDQREM